MLQSNVRPHPGDDDQFEHWRRGSRDTDVVKRNDGLGALRVGFAACRYKVEWAYDVGLVGVREHCRVGEMATAKMRSHRQVNSMSAPNDSHFEGGQGCVGAQRGGEGSSAQP
jgi:hypothetical protein